jgi:hypothetical protein
MLTLPAEIDVGLIFNATPAFEDRGLYLMERDPPLTSFFGLRSLIFTLAFCALVLSVAIPVLGSVLFL